LKPRTFLYFFREAFRGLVRNSLMSLAAIGIITIALLLFGLFYLFTVNLQHLGDLAWDKIEIRVFLEQNVEQVEEIGTKLAALPGVKSIKFIPKQEGAAALEKLLGNKNLFTEEDNPLPHCFNLSLTEGANIDEISRLASKVPGVEEVVFGQAFVKFLKIAIRIGLIVGMVFLLLTVCAVLYIVINTIQLTVYARRKEIEIMKLVGATDAFVRWPFLLEGMVLGLGGAALALILLTEGYTILIRKLSAYHNFIPLLPRAQVNSPLIIFLFTMGICFGAIGSLFSIKRYLKV